MLFHQIDESTVAVLAGTEQRVTAYACLPVMGFSATIGGAVTVARGAVIDNEPRTLITRYDKAPHSWTSKHFWRTALVDDSTVRGIVSADTVWEERVELPRER